MYVGRAGVIFIDRNRFPSKASIWANPFKIGRDGNLQQVLQKCDKHFRTLLENKPELKNELLALQGKNLGCWCVDSPTSEYEHEDRLVCHGQVLIRLTKEIFEQSHSSTG